MSFLRTLLQPVYEELPERALVGNAANILQIGEFQLLQLAYFEWFEQKMPEATTHRIFQAYMVKSDVPPWAHSPAKWLMLTPPVKSILITNIFIATIKAIRPIIPVI